MFGPEWIDTGRPGPLGKARDTRYREWDKKYGKGNWRLGWLVAGIKADYFVGPGLPGKQNKEDSKGGYSFGRRPWFHVTGGETSNRKYIIHFAGAVALYEDAYCSFFLTNGLVLEQLIAAASNVYDNAPSNVASGFDYRKQETPDTHLQDIAIRRCLLRMGRWFEGTALTQIRSSAGGTFEAQLSPGRVPFHRPDLIIRPELEGWWERGSIESFYQSNKHLLVKYVR